MKTLLLLLLAAGAGEGVQYRSQGAVPTHAGTARRIEELVVSAAARARRARPQADARLDEAATELAASLPDSGTPPLEIVDFALRRRGIIEPSPHLVLARCPGKAAACLESDMGEKLAKVFTQGAYNRFGIGFFEQRGETRLVVALSERQLELDPVPRAVSGARALVLAGRVGSPLRAPSVVITPPSGPSLRPEMTRPGSHGGGDAFRAQFQCGRPPGRYQVEVIAEGPAGAQVLANFPVYCGVAPPTRPPASSGPETVLTTPEQGERMIFELLGKDRARGKLPPLEWDGALAKVARAHSIDMRDHDFVAHLSPRTGGARERVDKAGLHLPIVLENVARAYSPEEAERGLMDSPGHRANVLSTEATHVGVGVALGNDVGGRREVFVTQVFARKVALGKPAEIERDTLLLIEKRRSAAGKRAAARDAALDQAAREFSQRVAAGKQDGDQGTEATERAAQLAKGRFGRIVGLHVALHEVANLPDATPLVDGAYTAIGIGAAIGPSKELGPKTLFLTIILAAGR